MVSGCSFTVEGACIWSMYMAKKSSNDNETIILNVSRQPMHHKSYSFVKFQL